MGDRKVLFCRRGDFLGLRALWRRDRCLSATDIIQCAGGQYLSSMPRKFEDQLLVMSCADDISQCRAAVDAGIPVVSAEFLLTGILQQKLDIATYPLFL